MRVRPSTRAPLLPALAGTAEIAEPAPTEAKDPVEEEYWTWKKNVRAFPLPWIRGVCPALPWLPPLECHASCG